MRNCAFLLVFCSVLLLSGTSFAGFVTFDCDFPDDPEALMHDWAYTGYDSAGNPVAEIHNSVFEQGDSAILAAANSWDLTLGETLSVMGIDQVVMKGETDEDPVFTVIKTITNTTGVDWTGYDLILTGNATFVNGTAGSTKFNSHSFSADFKTLSFSAPQIVLDGQSVTLQVDIDVPTTGLFEFTMTQNPVPEPATMILLGIGALALIRKR